MIDRTINRLRQFGPVIFVIVCLAVLVGMDWHRYLSLSALADHRFMVISFTDENLLYAAILFVLIFTVSITLSVPAGAFLTVASGFLFDIWLGGTLSVIGSTIGSYGLFRVAKTAVGKFFQARVRKFITKLESDFDSNAFYYLLMLRLNPVVPFWILNVASAFIGISPVVFFWSTFLGVIPGCFLFAWVGTGLGRVLTDMTDPSIVDLMTPDVLLPLVVLGVLSFLPIVYQKTTGNKLPGIDVEDPGPDIELDEK